MKLPFIPRLVAGSSHPGGLDGEGEHRFGFIERVTEPAGGNEPIVLFVPGFLTELPPEKNLEEHLQEWKEPLLQACSEEPFQLWIYHWPSATEKTIFAKFGADLWKTLGSLAPSAQEGAILAAISGIAGVSGTWRRAVRRADVVAEHLVRVCRDADRPIVLVGHSLGGRIALQAAHSARPPFAGVMALAPAVSGHRVDWSRLHRGSLTRPTIACSSNDRVLRWLYRLGQATPSNALGWEGPPAGLEELVRTLDMPNWNGEPVRHETYCQLAGELLLTDPVLREARAISALPENRRAVEGESSDDTACFVGAMERQELRADILTGTRTSLDARERVLAFLMGVMGVIPGLTTLDNRLVKVLGGALKASAFGVGVPGLTVSSVAGALEGVRVSPKLAEFASAADSAPGFMELPFKWLKGSSAQITEMGGLQAIAENWTEDLLGAAIVAKTTSWQCEMLGLDEGTAAFHEVKFIGYSTHALLSMFYNPSPASFLLAAQHGWKMVRSNEDMRAKVRSLAQGSIRQGEELLAAWDEAAAKMRLNDPVLALAMEGFRAEADLGDDDAGLRSLFRDEADEWIH